MAYTNVSNKPRNDSIREKYKRTFNIETDWRAD